MKNFALAGAVLTSPNTAFAELRERPRFWFPLVAVVFALVLQQAWYFQIVDIEWLKDHLFSGNARFDAMPPEARERVMSAMSPNAMMWSSIISVAIMFPLIFSALSAYYLLAGKIVNVQLSFKQWFAMATWSSLPTVIGLLASAGIMLTQGDNAQLGPSALQPLSLNELFFHLTPAHSAAQPLSSLNPITFWSWALSILAVKQWSQRTWLFSTAFVMLPSAVVYGVWLTLAF